MPNQPPLHASADDWLVYADHLQAEGDARGELIVLNHAVANGTPPEARDRYVKGHAAQLLGKASGAVDVLRLGWRWLSIETVEITARNDAEAKAAAALFESPAIDGLTSLTIAGDPQTENDKIDISPVVTAVVARGLPSLRSLSLIDARAARSSSVIATFYDPPANLVHFGELEAIWAKIAKVERVHVSVNDSMQVRWGQIALPAVKSFRVDCLTAGGDAQIPEGIIDANWPNLEELALRLPEHWTSSIPDDLNGYTRPYEDRDDDEYGDDDHNDGLDWSGPLQSLMTSLANTKLRKLTLTAWASPGSVVHTLAALPKSVVELDLSDSAFDEGAVETLLQEKDLLEQLKRLVLRNVPATKEQIAPLAAHVEVDHSEGAGASPRFLVGME